MTVDRKNEPKPPLLPVYATLRPRNRIVLKSIGAPFPPPEQQSPLPPRGGEILCSD